MATNQMTRWVTCTGLWWMVATEDATTLNREAPAGLFSLTAHPSATDPMDPNADTLLNVPTPSLDSLLKMNTVQPNATITSTSENVQTLLDARLWPKPHPLSLPPSTQMEEPLCLGMPTLLDQLMSLLLRIKLEACCPHRWNWMECCTGVGLTE